MRQLIFAATLTALTSTAFAQEEKSVTMDTVPQAAKDAAMANANGVTFDKVQMDSDEGTETYEFSGKMPSGMMLEVDVLADGTVEEIEQQIDISELPAEVKAALDKNLPNFAPTMVEKSTRRDNAVVYEFEGSHDGKEIDAEINADGSNYKINDDMAG